MKISELITELQNAKKQYGDIEVTVTHASMPDGWSMHGISSMPDVFETTCEHVIFSDKPIGSLKKRVRLWL